MAKVCSRCEFEGNPLRDFERWDKLCRNCRQWVGPRKRRTYRGIGERVVVQVPKRVQPSGRRALTGHGHNVRRAPERVSA